MFTNPRIILSAVHVFFEVLVSELCTLRTTRNRSNLSGTQLSSEPEDENVSTTSSQRQRARNAVQPSPLHRRYRDAHYIEIEPRKRSSADTKAYSFAFSVRVGIRTSRISPAASFKKNAIRSQPRFLLTMLNWTLFSLIIYAILAIEISTNSTSFQAFEKTHPQPSSITCDQPYPL